MLPILINLARIFESQAKKNLPPPKEASIEHAISPHKLRYFLFTWMKRKGVDDALIQTYSDHVSRKSLEVYSKLSLDQCQEEYENQISNDFPISAVDPLTP